MFDDDERPPAPRTVRDRRVMIAGVASVASGALIALVLVAPRGLAFNLLGLIGVLASPAAIAGLIMAGAGSSSRLAQRALSAWLTAYGLLIFAFVLAEVLSRLSSSLSLLAAYVALPAALALVVAGPLAGILLLRERDLPGWHRWVPIGLALALSIATLPGIGVPLPTPLLILLLPIMLMISGVGLLTLERAPAEQTGPAGEPAEPAGPADALG